MRVKNHLNSPVAEPYESWNQDCEWRSCNKFAHGEEFGFFANVAEAAAGPSLPIAPDFGEAELDRFRHCGIRHLLRAFLTGFWNDSVGRGDADD